MGPNWGDVDLSDAAVIADALSRQPLVRTAFSQYPHIARVPFLDAPRVGLGAVAGSLDRIAYNLLFVIKLENNLLTRDRAIAAAGGLDPHWLDRAASDLVVAGLATILDTGELTLFDDIADRIGLPLPSFNDHVLHITSDRLDRAAGRVGLGDVGTRKAERAAAMSAFLADGDAVRAALEGLSPSANEIFELLWQRTAAGIPGECEVEGAHVAYDFVPHELLRMGYLRGRSPIGELAEALLIGSDWNGYEIWIWAETAAAFGLRLTADWTPPSMPDAVALDPAGPEAIADALHALDEVIAATVATPAQGNKSGSRRPPVKYWRSVAKAAGLDAELTVRCGNLAIELGLLVPELGPTIGRGRNATRDCFWVPEPARLAEFGDQPAILRWAQLVERWLAPQLDPDEEAVQIQMMLLSALDHLPDGFGIPASGLSDYLRIRHSRFTNVNSIDDHLAGLIRFGVLASGTAVGLTPAGRALCNDLDALDRLYAGDPDEAAGLIVQTDHTVMCPPTVSLDTIIGLRRIAEPVSSGAVSVWRLSSERIARCSADDRFDVTDFLRSSSTVELPAGVERFLADAGGAASTITIRTVGCVITSTDHAALIDAARHKPAKLEVIAPGVAVSPLTEAKVAEVLRSKGVMLAGERMAGAAAPEPAPTWEIPHIDAEEPIPEVSPLLLGPDPAGSIESLAARLAEQHRLDDQDDPT